MSPVDPEVNRPGSLAQLAHGPVTESSGLAGQCSIRAGSVSLRSCGMLDANLELAAFPCLGLCAYASCILPYGK